MAIKENIRKVQLFFSHGKRYHSPRIKPSPVDSLPDATYLLHSTSPTGAQSTLTVPIANRSVRSLSLSAGPGEPAPYKAIAVRPLAQNNNPLSPLTEPVRESETDDSTLQARTLALEV